MALGLWFPGGGRADEINVKSFGATGDAEVTLTFSAEKGGGSEIAVTSGTDDTVAIQAAIDAWKARCALSAAKAAVLVFPEGVYRVTASLDFTGVTAPGAMIVFDGAIIFSEAEDKVALDFTASRWLTTHNLRLYGSAAAPPAVGLLHSRPLSGASSGEHIHYGMHMLGSYKKACIVNIAAESTTWIYPALNNIHDHDDAAVLMMGVRNVFGVISDFQDLPTGMNSFNGITMWQPQLRKLRRGYVGWIGGGMNGFHMRGGYQYMNNASDVADGTRDAYWLIEDDAVRPNDVLYFEGDIEGALASLGGKKADYFLRLENDTHPVRDLEIADHWGGVRFNTALVALDGSVGISGYRAWLNGDQGVKFYDRVSGTPALCGLDLRDTGGPSLASLDVMADFANLGVVQGMVSVRDHLQQLTSLESLGTTSGLAIVSANKGHRMRGQLHISREHNTPSAIPENLVAAFTTDDDFAADKGAALGLGGRTSATVKRAFGVIAGRKSNASNGNTSGYLTFHTHQNGVGLNEWMRIDDAGLTEIKGTVAMTALPTSDPGVAGQLWNDSGTVKISAGA